MRFVNYKVTLKGDTITIPLDRPCKCNVGLVEISIPEIESHEMDFNNAIDITCDQINSTFDNPNRLLRRLPLSKIEPKKYYHTWEARFIQMEPVDSQDRFLTLKIRRTRNNESLILGSIFDDYQIFLTLAYTDIDEPKTWTAYI